MKAPQKRKQRTIKLPNRNGYPEKLRLTVKRKTRQANHIGFNIDIVHTCDGLFTCIYRESIFLNVLTFKEAFDKAYVWYIQYRIDVNKRAKGE